MRNTLRVTVLCCAAATLFFGIGRAAAQSITAVTVTKNAGNSADNFQDGVFESFQRTSVTPPPISGPTTSFTTRYSFVVGTDTGIFTSSSDTLNSDYRINFTVTAPGAYVLNVSESRNGALTIVDDGTGSATATLGAVSGSQTGGTLASGSLNLPARPNLSSGNSPFDATTTATISGTSNGVAKPHQLTFTWTSSCSSSSSLTGGDECAVRGGIPIGYTNETAGDYPGAGGRNSATDGHIITVTLVSLCGNGTVDSGAGEQCDEGLANGSPTSCCTATCQFRATGQQCRASADVCDTPEFCTGFSGACPTDIFLPGGTVCRAASPGQVCDEDETCTGTGASCPPDLPKPNGTLCRASAGVCDLAEVCDGVSKNCPTDIKSTAPCRPAAGVCDNAESCDGVSNNCPADGFKSAATPCRPAVDVCDQTENCPGNAANCPADLPKPSGTACPADGNPCTVDQCDGVSTACQHPAGNAGALCRPDAGDCDVAETCTGASTTCPADGFEPSGTTCTTDNNPCTVDECNGSGTCQHTAGNSGAQCRAAVDLCDVAETCDGSSSTCPPDEVAPNTTVCRAASPGQLCDEDELCDGSSTACPADEVKPNGTECRASAGDCDVAEQCDGVSKLCPTDAFAPASTGCRASAGTCDPAENCTGSSATCPPDVLELNGTPCRASAGVCDVVEQCDGVSAVCPPDGFASSSTPCRASTGVCDIAENCTGGGPLCPTDLFQPDGTDCSDGQFCNGDESCAGGACQSGTSPCGMGQNCDESTDQCFTGSCPSTAVACRSAQKSLLLIKNKMDNTKDKLVWKWIKGASTTQAEFADPTSTATYALCIYGGASASLIGSAEVPPSGAWSPIGTKGYKYKDLTGTQAGIQKITLKGSDSNKAKALVKGKGDGLPDLTLPFQMTDFPIVVQLRNNLSGLCWAGSYASGLKNTSDQFKGKTP